MTETTTMSSHVRELTQLSGEEVDQLMAQLKVLRNDNEIMKRLVSTLDRIRQLMTNQMSKCLCRQSVDTKFKTQMNVLNHKYDELKSRLDLNSLNSLTKDMIVVKSEQPIDDTLDEQPLDLLDDNRNDHKDVNQMNDLMTSSEEISELFVNKVNQKPNIIYINMDNIEVINRSDHLNSQSKECDEEVDTDVMDGQICCDFVDSKSSILCRKRFESEKSLTSHKRRHSGPKPWFCDYKTCQYRAVLRSHLIGHIRKSHTGRYQFSCDWPGCSFMGPSRYNVKRHKIIHTGEKPYKCNWPGCEWKSANNKVADHKRIHTGERPYPCSWVGCEARFSRPFTLRNHERTHTGDKPFVCDYPNCEYRSSQQTPLVTHKRKHHSMVSVATEEVIFADSVIISDE